MNTKTTTARVKRTLNETDRIKIRDGLMMEASRKMRCAPRDLFVAICVHDPKKFYEWCYRGDVPPDPLEVLSDDDIRELAECSVEEYFDGIRQVLLPVLFAIIRESKNE